MIRGFSKIFKLLRITGDASPIEGGSAHPRSRKNVTENDASKTEPNTYAFRVSDIADDCSSLDSFESAKSSEKLDEQPKITSHGDATKRLTPLGLQPRPSIEMIRKKLRLNDNHQIAESPGEGESISNQLHCVYTTSNSEQHECDASFSISTPNITYGTTLTAVGAFVAEADKERENREPSRALVLNLMNRDYLGKKLTNKLGNFPQGKLTSKNSIRSISSIYSPLRSTSEASILPQADDRCVADSPASSSSFSSEDDFSSTQHHNKLQSWILGSCQFDPTSLPPYQMIETPEKRRHQRTKHGGRIQNWNSYSQRDDFSKTTARRVEKYTSSMLISSPSSSANNSYNGVEYGNISDDEHDVPQLMLLTPGRASSTSEQNVATPDRLQLAHSSLIMTSPSSYSAYPPRTFCNAATAARFLEASFEQALLQKGSTVVAQPMRQVGFANTAHSSDNMKTNGKHVVINDRGDDMDTSKNFREMENSGILSADRKEINDTFTSDSKHHLVRVSKRSKVQLPYDFGIIDDCVNDLSDIMIDTSNQIRDTKYSHAIEPHIRFKDEKIKRNEISLPSLYSGICLDASKETSIICYDVKDLRKERGITTEKQPQSLVDQAGRKERLLLERKRENQWKSKVLLLQRMIWCLQDNLELVLDIETQSDDFYECCPPYVQSSTFDGPVFVKTMSNEEGIIPGYTEGTQHLLTHQLSTICTGEHDVNMRDALEFVKSIIQRKKVDCKKLTTVKKYGILRKLSEFGDSNQLSPGFTAPTNSYFDPNLSLASTISSIASFVLNSNNSYSDQPRRTILIASSLLQKITYALQNLMNGEGKNQLQLTKNAIRHCYLQLIDLSRKHIQDVLDLFSIVEDVADSSVKQGADNEQHSSMYQSKVDSNLITFTHPLEGNKRSCIDDQSSAVNSVTENILLKQSQNATEIGSTDHIECATCNDENARLVEKVGDDSLVSPVTASLPEQSENAVNQKLFLKKTNRIKKKKLGDIKNSLNRTVLGSL